MIGRLVADGKSWMYILRNYASILQMYTKQVILCNFINVIIVMKTSLIRIQNFIWSFFPFYHIEIQFNIDTRWAGEVRLVSNCSFLQKSADCLSIIGGSFNETFNLVVSTKKSSADQSLIQNRWKHRPTIDRQSPENPTPHFCSPKIGRLSAWVNVNNRIINHVKCTEICS